MYVFMCMCVCYVCIDRACVCIDKCGCVRACRLARYLYVYVCMYVYVCLDNVYIDVADLMCMCMYVYMQLCRERAGRERAGLRDTCMYICIYVFLYILYMFRF